MKLLSITCTIILIGLISCTNTKTEPKLDTSVTNYSKPLKPGQPALEFVTYQEWPDIGRAWQSRDLFLQDSVDYSIEWFKAPSSKMWFPIEGISHEQAKKSVIEFQKILQTSSSKQEFISAIKQRFNVYKSVGCDGDGTVLFTGYYSPDFQASRTQSDQFKAPLYNRPDDLATDPHSGQPLGRLTSSGSIEPWPARKALESSGELDGTELVYVRDDLDAYTIHVNGSARLRMDDGEIAYIGYAGKTDKPYKGLGHSVLEAGLIPPDGLSLRAIRRMYNKNPEQIKSLIDKNESYVFFREYDGSNWPAGSLGVPVTARRSVATDKKIFPRGSVVLVDTTVQNLTGESESFTQFMTDQDTGGAIRAPGRADLFMGIGPTAGIKAGGQYAEGRLFYLFLKPESIASVEP